MPTDSTDQDQSTLEGTLEDSWIERARQCDTADELIHAYRDRILSDYGRELLSYRTHEK